MSEEVWQEIYLTGDGQDIGFWFWLDLRDIPIDSTVLIHTQAIEGLVRLGHGTRGEVRPLVRNALQAIAHLTEVRLAHAFGWGPASQYWVQAAISPSDSDEAIAGDRARFLTWASQLAAQPDTAAGAVWGAVTDGFRQDPRPGPAQGGK